MLFGTGAWAADEYLYIVNATGAPAQFVVDAQVYPLMDHLQALATRTTMGEHVILAGKPESLSGPLKPTGGALSVNLTAATAVIDARKRTFWCFIVGKQGDEVFRIIPIDQPKCTEFIRRGVGDRPLK